MRSRPVTTKDLEDFIIYAYNKEIPTDVGNLLYFIEDNDVGPEDEEVEV